MRKGKKKLKLTRFVYDTAIISEKYNYIKKNNTNMEDSELILNALTSHFFMRNLDSRAKRELIKQCGLCFIEAKEVICQEETEGSYFYIIQKGNVKVTVKGKEVKQLKAGDSFGEQSLIHGGMRTSTVVSLTPCSFYLIDRVTFRKIINHINISNFKEIKSFIEKVEILSCLDEDQKFILCNSMMKEIYRPEEEIVKEGDTSNCLFLIKEGEVECSNSAGFTRVLQKGDVFGEASIIVDQPRMMTVSAVTSCVCYSISVDTLTTMMGGRYRDSLIASFVYDAFKNSKTFSKIDVSLVQKTVEAFNIRFVKANEIGIKRGEDKHSRIRVIIEGGLKDSFSEQLVGSRGEVLFDGDTESIVENNLFASPDCIVAEASKEEMAKIIGMSVKETLYMCDITSSLRSIELFKNFEFEKLRLLAKNIVQTTVEKGEEIIRQGEYGNSLCFIKEGKVGIYSDKVYIRTISTGDYMGERALFFKEERTASAIAETSVSLYELSKENFLSIIDDKMRLFLEERFHLRDNTVKLKDLKLISKLGKGTFGRVCLVQSVRNKNKYAIKSVDKSVVDYYRVHENIDTERKILLQIDHPFIVKLVKTLKHGSKVFFLMEYLEGQEMFDLIRDIGLMKPQMCRFYAASLVHAIDFLHLNSFVYRDIKPENMIVTKDVPC